LNHIHAANLWNKLSKQRIERRHEERLEQLVQRMLDLVSSCNARALANIAHVAKCQLQTVVVRSLYAAELLPRSYFSDCAAFSLASPPRPGALDAGLHDGGRRSRGGDRS